MSSTPKPKVPRGLLNFNRLNPSTWYLQPTTTTDFSSSPSSPDLILLIGWMDASPRHISKYTSGYKTLYPTSRVLAITNTAFDCAWRSIPSNQTRLSPALEILYSLPPETKLLVHFFSNGGAMIMNLITKSYLSKTGRKLPVKGVIMDSSPGKAVFAATVRAFAVGLPKNVILNFIGMLWLILVFLLYVGQYRARGIVDNVEQARRDLNDISLMEKVPRLYIYSEADPMVDWRFVEEHGEDASAIGYRIEREKFVGSGHCEHLLVDGERYWKVVQRLWSLVPLD